MVARMPDRKYAFFRDDQIVLLVNHTRAFLSPDPDDLEKKRIPELENLFDRMERGRFLGEAKIDRPATQIFTFPKPTAAELDLQAKIISSLQDRLNKKNKPYNPADFEPQAFADDQDTDKQGFSIIVANIDNGKAWKPDRLIQAIRELRKGRDFISNPQELRVLSVSPNWLMGNSSQGGTTGGPGGIPKTYKGKDEDVGTRANFNIVDTLKEKGLYGNGENVDVVVFDTLPSGHDLVFAHKEWQNQNHLIKKLLGLNGKLQPHEATIEQLQRMALTSFNRHNYPMSDHGLFIAGIIHSIVPEATIHLYEVLNEFGVGDLLSLAQAFHRAYNEVYRNAPPGRKTVFNCSLVLELPLVDEHCYADTRKDPIKDKERPDTAEDEEFEQQVLQLVKEAQQPAFEIQELCNKLYCVGRQVVAAAGNDWENGKARHQRNNRAPAGATDQPADEPRGDAPPARYPAGFDSVIGVGAMPRNPRANRQQKYKASTFSNIGDKPAGDAIMTLGGEEGEARGVLGLYLSDKFPRRVKPDEDKNEMTIFTRRPNKDDKKTEINHWAWWAGTSFAAPIVTGAIAAVLSNRLPDGTYRVDNTEDAIQELYAAGVILDGAVPGPDTTDAGEDVMEVKQGP
jgi:hypothetical protein